MSAEFPFIGSTAIIEDDDDRLPRFAEYSWDFEKDCFLYDEHGRHVVLYENEAMKVWVYKALQTERFAYLAYSWRYGIQLKPFIGKVMSVQDRKNELKRVIIECLMVNPYIKSIDKVEFESKDKGNILNTTITLTTIYGEMSIYV
ncbi:MAG: DUF2634 domain-containing protein [Schwartzia sp.]|nr:DUF2634 domain-containing protein [Schwartzia sp. (in: firmicutes)]